MKRSLYAFFAASLLSCSTMALAASEIPVDRVVLSTSGLANFMHQMQVTGNAKVEFPVRLEQVDDILKSLLVFDKKGRLGGVTLPGKQPLAQVFKDLPFSQGQLSNPMLLLNAYQGASVTLKTAKGSIAGKLLQVAPEQTVFDGGKTETKNRISIMTAEGLKQAVLEDAQSVQFDDHKIKGEIARALDAVRENGSAERRVLTVSLPGDGARNVALSYVVEAPLWKAAYRLVVPEEGEKKGLLQGWAVVENMTASDWNNVDMTLVSGNPVTFRQNLYESYYVSRPEIPVQVFGRVMPRVDQGAMSLLKDKEMDADDMPARRSEGKMQMKSRGAPAAAPAMAMEAAGFGGAFDAMTMNTVALAANAAQSAEATTQVLYRFPDRFTLKSGQSIMLPFSSREVPMERIALYQPDTHATHPLAAVELKNDGETGLPPGILTLYEESPLLKGASFVGDAQLPVLTPGEKRLVSYALDSKTTINKESKSLSTEGRISISRGVMRTAVKNRAETVYTIKAPPKESRLVVIEHPKMYDYALVSPDPKDAEMTDTHFRLRVPVKAGETKKFSVVLENDGWQTYSIVNMSTDEFVAYATARGNLDPATRKAFAEMAEARRAVDEIEMKIRALEEKRRRIFEDQQRVRENLKSLPGKSDIQQKYLDKMNEQEDQIVKIDAEKEDLAAERAKRLEKLQKMIDGLSI